MEGKKILCKCYVVLTLFVFLKMMLVHRWHWKLLFRDWVRFQKVRSATAWNDISCEGMRDKVEYTLLEHWQIFFIYLSYSNSYTLHGSFWDLPLVLFLFFFFYHFNLHGLLAALRVSLFSPHQFVQYFQQLCVTANSQWSYCTLFALGSKKKKSCRQTVPPRCGARDSAKTACQAAAATQLHQRLMLPPCLVDFGR